MLIKWREYQKALVSAWILPTFICMFFTIWLSAMQFFSWSTHSQPSSHGKRAIQSGQVQVKKITIKWQSFFLLEHFDDIEYTITHSIEQINVLKLWLLCSQKISLFKSGVEHTKFIYSKLKKRKKNHAKYNWPKFF